MRTECWPAFLCIQKTAYRVESANLQVAEVQANLVLAWCRFGKEWKGLGRVLKCWGHQGSGIGQTAECAVLSAAAAVWPYGAPT